MADWVLEFINDYGLLAIFIIVTLEYSCFPVPSEMVLPTAGAMAVSMGISFWYILLLCSVAGLIGSLICYSVGYYGGIPLLNKIKKKFPRTKKRIDASTLTYEKYSNLSVCFGRIIPLCRTYISFIAGVAKQNVMKYILYTLVGIVLWNSVLLYLGYTFYDNIDYVATIIEKYKQYVIIIFILILIFIFTRFIYKKIFKNKFSN